MIMTMMIVMILILGHHRRLRLALHGRRPRMMRGCGMYNNDNNIYYHKLFQILWYGYLRVYHFTRYYSQYFLIYEFEFYVVLKAL